MKIATLIAVVAIILAQPTFGFYAIPKFFNYSIWGAFVLALVDVSLLFGVAMWAVFDR